MGHNGFSIAFKSLNQDDLQLYFKILCYAEFFHLCSKTL